MWSRHRHRYYYGPRLQETGVKIGLTAEIGFHRLLNSDILCPSSVEFKGSKLERSWVNMQNKTFWDNWWSNSETLIPIERRGQFPRQLYTTIALPYVRSWRQRCWPLDMGSTRFPWWVLFRKMPKTLGKNTNVSDRSFLGYSPNVLFSIWFITLQPLTKSFI